MPWIVRQLRVLVPAIVLIALAPCTNAREPDTIMRKNVRVAGVVLKWIRGDKRANFARAEPLIREAAREGAHLVCTTECFLDGYAIDDKSIPLEQFRALGEPIPKGQYFVRLSELADELDIFLVAGLLERDGEQLFNTAIWLGPDGTLIGRYRKQQLEHEAVRITAGLSCQPIESDLGSIGTMICADRRDPQLVGELCSQGAQWLLCPSGGMYGPDKNDPILQRRSRETDKYIVFVHPAEFLVTAPDGTIVARTLLGDTRDIDPHEVDSGRDSRGVFYFDLERRHDTWHEPALHGELRESIIGEDWPYRELRSYVDQRVATLNTPNEIGQWKAEAAQLRESIRNDVFLRGEAAAWRAAPLRCEWVDDIPSGSGYRIRRFRYEAVPGMWIPGLLYEPSEFAKKMPVVLNVNGHHRGGKAMPYKQRRCINLAKRGMLAFNLEFIGMGQLRDKRMRGNAHNRLMQIDLCGTSGVAPFYLALERGLDVALAHPHADPKRVGITGLSGGGWQTIVLASLDTRVTLANPVAGYCSLLARTGRRNNVGDAEQIPANLGAVADYTHLTALVAPRPLLLTYNAKDDCCFLPADVLPLLREAANPVYELFGQSGHICEYINHVPGDHNFGRDNRNALYRFLREHFNPQASEFATRDMPIDDDEIQTEEELAVPLPTDNATLNSLATELSRPLPVSPPPPTGTAELRSWQVTARQRLRELVAWEHFAVNAQRMNVRQIGDVEVARWQIRCHEDWTVPAVSFSPAGAEGSVVVLGDFGRSSCFPLIDAELLRGQRVLAIDLWGFGEARGDLDKFEPQLLATVGRPAIGRQAGQLAAAARWFKQRHGRDVDVRAYGPRTSTIALLAAAIETDSIVSLYLHHPLRSLKELIEKNVLPDDAPELFCFGLLQETDVAHLTALVSPRRVVVEY